MLGEFSDGDAAIRRFIAQRQPRVLASAVATLSTCSSAELVAVTHRLAGTLGSYRLDRARAEVEELHRLAQLPCDADRLAAHRAATLSALTALARAALAQAAVSEQLGDEQSGTAP